ncbi:MAG: 3'-5' exonuclease [Candidatus Doudnabacteria bacterium]
MSQEKKYKYCSIDLEFTGFDPEKDQVLEIGFAFFNVTKQGIEVGEQWSQVFKPTIPVHEKIYGLTGISPEELDSAPMLSEYVDFLSTKLSDVTILGHNPVLDVKFLEAAGVKLSGLAIDTLELVQFLLPTHHSYNLENLAHYFDIKHAGSHRALSDALTTISLLQNLLSIYATFDEQLKTDLLEVMSRGQFVWHELFEMEFFNRDVVRKDSLVSEQSLDIQTQLDLNSKVIVFDKPHLMDQATLEYLKQNHLENYLLVVPEQRRVLELWQSGLAEGLFGFQEVYDSENFVKFKNQAVTNEELRFCLKILVWEKINWQSKTVLDLNLSFFGGQFKSYIVGKNTSLDNIADQQNLVCDYPTMFEIMQSQNFENKKVLIVDLQNFESYLTQGARTRVSWNGLSYGVKLLYNPETDYGQKDLEDQVSFALSSLDLFFGLIQIVLRQKMKSTYISVTDLKNIQPYYYNKLVSAAINLLERLEPLVGLGDIVFDQKIKNLKDFFTEQHGIVKWFSLQEDNVVLHSQPIDLNFQIQEIKESFSSVSYIDSMLDRDTLFYYDDRLEFNNEQSDISTNTNLWDNFTNIDLQTEHDIFEFIMSQRGKQVVVFSDSLTLKNFYKNYYQQIKEHKVLLAQDYSGSGNKMFRNFSLFEDVVLLATSPFLIKQKYKIQVDVLSFLALPTLDENHPYNLSLAQIEPELFAKLRKNYTNMEIVKVIKVVSGANLPTIFVRDPR